MYKIGEGAPITPRGWMGVDGMDLNHRQTQKIHIKIFLMRGQKRYWVSVVIGGVVPPTL